MAAIEAPWSSLRVLFYNDSAITFNHSTSNPPILRACTPQGPVYGFRPDRHGACVLLERTEAPNEGAAFFTFDMGQYEKKLIVFLCIKPEESAADIKVGIFDIKTVFDEILLEKLVKAEIEPDDVGLVGELYWEFDAEGEKRELGIRADLKSKELVGSLSDRWSSDTPEVWLHIRDFVHYQKTLSSPADQTKEFKIAATPGQFAGAPVHENLTLAALIMAGILPKETTYGGIIGWNPVLANQPDTFEYLRGVMWNDDPACHLFINDIQSNCRFSLGLDWACDYEVKFKLFSSDNITWRSHFGNLQFLHAMATDSGEDPKTTKWKIMRWLEVMYGLSAGHISPGERIDRFFGDFFNNDTEPKGSASLSSLLRGTTRSYYNPLIDRRALGSCFHLIQDSYAIGHVQRYLENRDEMVDVVFKKDLNNWSSSFWHTPKPIIKGFGRGHCGRFTFIENFHCYKDQGDKHGHYDDIPNNETLDPSDIWSFNCIMGGMDAIKKCAKLAEFWARKQRWEDGVCKFLDEEVFMLRNAGLSNTGVDGHLRG